MCPPPSKSKQSLMIAPSPNNPSHDLRRFQQLERRSDHEKRVEFALFLKVLLRCLEKSNQSLLLQQARLVVVTCTRGNRMGDPSFSPLSSAIEMRLRKLIGDHEWQQAKNYTRFYQRRQEVRRYRQVVASSNVFHRPIVQS